MSYAAENQSLRMGGRDAVSIVAREELSVPFILQAKPQGRLRGKPAAMKKRANLRARDVECMLVDIDAKVAEPHVIVRPKVRLIGGIGKALKNSS